jgi:plasmid stabilization system protein ParE
VKRQVVASRRADRQITKALAWWHSRRDKAPEALRDELERVKALLAEVPYAGEAVRGTHRRGARRLRLNRVGYHLYYEITRDTIVILILWHSSRRPPKL